MTITQHTVASIVTSAYFYSISRSFLGTVMCFLVGIFIDVDHAIDYCWRKKKMCWKLSDLEHFSYHEKEGRVFLFFHAYELMLLGWIIVFLFFNNPVLVGMLFGATIHLLLDQIFNDVYPWAYFLFFRARFGFPHKIFYREDFQRDILSKKK